MIYTSILHIFSSSQQYNSIIVVLFLDVILQQLELVKRSGLLQARSWHHSIDLHLPFTLRISVIHIAWHFPPLTQPFYLPSSTIWLLSSQHPLSFPFHHPHHMLLILLILPPDRPVSKKQRQVKPQIHCRGQTSQLLGVCPRYTVQRSTFSPYFYRMGTYPQSTVGGCPWSTG